MKKKTVLHTFLVVRNDAVNLFGRDLCSKFRLCIAGCTNNIKPDILEEFKDYLATDFTSNVRVPVSLKVLPEVKPKFVKARPIPVSLRQAVKEELQRLVDLGKITKVFSSQYASPTVHVRKSDGSLRICGDYSATINQFLEPVHTILPTIDEVIAKVGSATVFSNIDLSNAFLQLPLTEESRQYTTINTSEGLFSYNFLPFGLSASPGIFQAYMNELMKDVDNVIVYQDDLLVLSDEVEAHKDTLRKVLTTLRVAGLKINRSKSSFFSHEIRYLGHVFTKEGVRPSRDKIRAIIEAPAPVNVKQVQAFIGLCNFYRRFIPRFSEVLAPLYALTRANVQFQWKQLQQESFELMKSSITKNNVLRVFNPKHQTLLETDSSGYGVAAVLMQRQGISCDWHPVEFASRTLNAAEKSYSNIEREALSVVFGCKKFRHYLLGNKFVIRNDQKPLNKLFAHGSSLPTTCSARIQRWALFLTLFHYKFEYSKGELNVNSDCLSRLPMPDTVVEDEPYELVFAIRALAQLAITCEDVKYHTKEDPGLSELMNLVKYGGQIKQKGHLSMYKNIFPCCCNNLIHLDYGL